MKQHSQQLLFGCVLLMSWVPAHAYLDPGTGSALIQGIVAAIAAVGVTLKLYWHRIIGFFKLRKNKNSTQPDTDTDE